MDRNKYMPDVVDIIIGLKPDGIKASNVLDLLQQVELTSIERVLNLAEISWDACDEVGDHRGRMAIDNLIDTIRKEFEINTI